MEKKHESETIYIYIYKTIIVPGTSGYDNRFTGRTISNHSL